MYGRPRQNQGIADEMGDVMESGLGGAEVEEAVPGDFLYVPPGAVQREGSPAAEEGTAVIVRFGSGPPVVNMGRVCRGATDGSEQRGVGSSLGTGVPASR
jgi:hypothetical protein